MSTQDPTRYLLVDEDEEHLLAGILNDATGQHPEHVAAWRAHGPGAPGAVVHGAVDGEHLVALPASLAPRRWMVEQLQALAATADHAGRVHGWARREAVEALARRIPDGQSDGPGWVRVGFDDLRTLLDAAEGAAGRSPQNDADRAWLETVADVVDRVGIHLATHWTEDLDRG